MFLKTLFKNAIRALGYDIAQTSMIPYDMEEGFTRVYRECHDFTMTSVERMYALYQAVAYVEKCCVAGDVVECGVWRGGSSMLSALTLKSLGSVERRIYLYDTYEGMSQPSEKDVAAKDQTWAGGAWKKARRVGYTEWCYSSLDEVRLNMLSTGYPNDKLEFVKGKVEDTIPGTIPASIAILRLDTDWYESTYHELVHLYPRLSIGGVLIIDDYGYWKGAREAVDRFFAESQAEMLLLRVDDTGRIGVKTGSHAT